MNYIDCDRLIFNYQYSGALHDSTAQLAYKGKKIWMGQIAEAREAVYEHIERILKGSFHDQTEYDAAFERTAHIVCDEFNKAGLIYNPEHPDEYTFGNAQKLINMTCKNMYAVTYGRPELKDNFHWCHCPMDSIMLNRIWNAYSSAGNDLAALGDKYNFLKSWGNEDWDDRSRYNAFQYAVRILCKQILAEQGGPLIPIELDYFLWSE